MIVDIEHHQVMNPTKHWIKIHLKNNSSSWLVYSAMNLNPILTYKGTHAYEDKIKLVEPVSVNIRVLSNIWQ